ncbi:MAG: DUF3352 domain-containing protein [bacterium]|nr:DUF3352 domain-containing protein [bacterium]
MRTLRLVWILCGLCVLVGTPCEEASLPKLSEMAFEKMLPEDTIFYMYASDTTAFVRELKGSNAYKILEEINPISLMEGQPEFERAKEFYTAYIEPLTKVFHKRVAIAVKNIPPGPGIPGVVLLADVPDAEKEAALRKYFNEQIHPLLNRIGVQRITFTHGAYEVEQLSFARPAPFVACYTIADGLFIATLGREIMESILDRKFPAKTLAESELLQEVRRAVGDVVIYANTAALLESGRPVMPEKVATILRVSGLDSIKAIGLGGETLGTASLGKWYLFTGSQPKGFLGLLAKEVPPPKVVNYVPADCTVLYAFSLGDKAVFYDELMGALRETFLSLHGNREWERLSAGIRGVEEKLGFQIRDDLLAPFGSEMCVALKVPEVLGFPPTFLLLEVKDAEKAQAAIDKLIASLEKGIGASVMRTTQDYKGVAITSVSLMPGGRGMAAGIAALPLMRPAFAVVGDFLVVSVHANLVKKIVDVHQGEKSLKDNPDFQRVFSKLSPSGTVTSYVNMKEIYDFLYGTFGGLAATQVGAEMMGKLGRISQYFGSAGGRLSWDGKGILSESFSDSGGAEQILAQMAVMYVLPKLASARGRAQETACLSNLRQLSVACMMYANDHDDVLPSKLSDLHPEYVPGTDVFLCPIHRSGKAVKKVVDIDADSDYELRLPGQKLGEVKDPGRTVMIWEKQLNHRGERNTAFVDGHVERGGRIGQTEVAPPVTTPKAAAVSFGKAFSRPRL